MNTTSHAFWAYLILRKTPYKKYTGWFALGAVIPDAIYYIGLPPFFLYAWMNGGTIDHSLWHGFFENPVIHIIRLAGHSFAIWLFGMALWRYLPFRFLWFGWLFHVITDFLTHATDATPVFYPFSSWTFHSPVSYYDPRYYGDWFQIIDTTLVVGIGTYLLIHTLRKRKNEKKWSRTHE